ncbi:beta-glucosidase [Sphaerisporangium rufum]|uniref:Beta-glucosidase n=1 Tax=Sphaerisporangium rufum TaxID=1381558 RepID=A0A919UYM4_9ACTN|nr:GH1 family beta-glucosidase [Sphaerisporangium rufum]GII75267.1 beta-glucosidase [Sphaerisporangium rufum]
MTITRPDTRQRELRFPDGFVWGAATAAYQVEGAAAQDGRGPSIWDAFSHTPGNVANGDTGDVACDHYHRYADDVRLMAGLGLRAYRFSVSWPRVMPAGRGPVNAAGLDFYDRLVDELLGAGIAPYATLYHWDLPLALERTGGWAARDTAARFAEYAAIVHDRLGDRVAMWTTLNEPWLIAFLGYAWGIHAPGRTEPAAAFRAAHHLLLGHGLATTALRAGGARQVSLTFNLSPIEGPEEAARPVDGLMNRQFLEPALRGRYPADVLAIAERHGGLGHIRDGDLALIDQPIDVIGINYYNPSTVSLRPGAPANPAFPGTEGVHFEAATGPTTAMGWPIVPEALTALLLRLSREYPEAGLLVTENGAAFEDTPREGAVPDPDRVAYLDGHLRAAHAAIEAGADLRGYLVWSLLDNFEWHDGYRRRFGIVYVDFETQRRLPKDSALWYRDVIRRNGLPR